VANIYEALLYNSIDHFIYKWYFVGENLFCYGGAEIVNELLQNDLIDEYIISVVPILVGKGTKLFKDGRPEQKLKLIKVKAFKTGLTQLHYRRVDK